MGIKRRSLFVAATIAALVVGMSPAALADDDDRDGRIELDSRFQGWFSNGMINDPEACGPFDASDEAVVWHLYADLPAGVDTNDDDDDTEVSVKFGGDDLKSRVRYRIESDRIDIWARVESRRARGNPGAHTSIERARLEIEEDDGGLPDVALQLGSVCYDDLGPVGKMAIRLQGMVCDGYHRLPGNQINAESLRWDATDGAWESWGTVSKEDRPRVEVSKPTEGCSYSGNQRFAIGTSSDMDDYHEIPGTTRATNRGLIELSSTDLPPAHQRALFWVHEQLWVQSLDNDLVPGVFHCYEDSLHPDDYEWILFRDYNRLPSSITCISWKVDPTYGVR